MKALIFDGRVVQVEPQGFPVAPALKWINIAGMNPQPWVGWSFGGAGFAPPPPAPPVPSLSPEARLSVAGLWAILKAKGVVSAADLP